MENQLINSMIDAIQSLIDGLYNLAEECQRAFVLTQRHNEVRYWQSKDVDSKLTTDKCKAPDHLMSECQKLTDSFVTVTQQMCELIVALRLNAIQTGNTSALSLAFPLLKFILGHIPEVAVEDNIDASDDAVDGVYIHTYIPTPPAPPLPDVAVEHNMEASDNAVEHNMAASENAGEHSTAAHASHPGSA